MSSELATATETIDAEIHGPETKKAPKSVEEEREIIRKDLEKRLKKLRLKKFWIQDKIDEIKEQLKALDAIFDI